MAPQNVDFSELKAVETQQTWVLAQLSSSRRTWMGACTRKRVTLYI